jgi:hypothetical protein
MARIPWSALIGFVVPLVLIIINLVWGVGGILVFIMLVCWLGLAVFLMTPEDRRTA